MNRYIPGGIKEVFFPKIWKSCEIVMSTGLKAMIYAYTNHHSALTTCVISDKSLNLRLSVFIYKIK